MERRQNYLMVKMNSVKGKNISGRRITLRQTRKLFMAIGYIHVEQKKIICDVSNESNSHLFLFEIKITLGYFYLRSLE